MDQSIAQSMDQSMDRSMDQSIAQASSSGLKEEILKLEERIAFLKKLEMEKQTAQVLQNVLKQLGLDSDEVIVRNVQALSAHAYSKFLTHVMNHVPSNQEEIAKVEDLLDQYSESLGLVSKAREYVAYLVKNQEILVNQQTHKLATGVLTITPEYPVDVNSSLYQLALKFVSNPRPENFKLELVFVVDNSGSMQGQKYADAIILLKSMLTTLVSHVTKGGSLVISIGWFNSCFALVVNTMLITEVKAINMLIEQIDDGLIPLPRGQTDFSNVFNYFTGVGKLNPDVKFIILTDGEHTGGYIGRSVIELNELPNQLIIAAVVPNTKPLVAMRTNAIIIPCHNVEEAVEPLATSIMARWSQAKIRINPIAMNFIPGIVIKTDVPGESIVCFSESFEYVMAANSSSTLSINNESINLNGFVYAQTRGQVPTKPYFMGDFAEIYLQVRFKELCENIQKLTYNQTAISAIDAFQSMMKKFLAENPFIPKDFSALESDVARLLDVYQTELKTNPHISDRNISDSQQRANGCTYTTTSRLVSSPIDSNAAEFGKNVVENYRVLSSANPVDPVVIPNSSSGPTFRNGRHINDGRN